MFTLEGCNYSRLQKIFHGILSEIKMSGRYGQRFQDVVKACGRVKD